MSGWYGGYGKCIQIDHGNGIVTLYGHNSQVVADVGQTVKKGEVIAYMGSTGASTGSHLHYEVRVNGTAVNPANFL
jgi:murein DD-endopeptidase MepM/ murein hydrolase activator NlpD